MCTLKIIDNAVIKAVEEYLRRKNRESHPDGTFDNARRWYPSETERCDCCSYVREPSRAYPYSIMIHCRSIGHIASQNKIDKSVLRKVSGQLLRSIKCKVELSVWDAAEIVADKNKDITVDKLPAKKNAPKHRIYTSEDFPDGGY